MASEEPSSIRSTSASAGLPVVVVARKVGFESRSLWLQASAGDRVSVVLSPADASVLAEQALAAWGDEPVREDLLPFIARGVGAESAPASRALPTWYRSQVKQFAVTDAPIAISSAVRMSMALSWGQIYFCNETCCGSRSRYKNRSVPAPSRRNVSPVRTRPGCRTLALTPRRRSFRARGVLTNFSASAP